MTCGACKKLIEIELEDAGFGMCIVDEKLQTITIPQECEDDLTKIATAIDNAGGYKLITD